MSKSSANVPVRNIVLVVMVLAAMSLPLAGQGSQVGFVRLVNVAAAGEGNLMVTLDGNKLWPQGIKLGQRTSGLGLKAGKKEFVLTKTGCKGAKRSIDVVAGETQTLVFYSQPVRDEDGKIVEWELKVARLRQHTPEEGLYFTVISFCEDEEMPVEIFEAVSQKSRQVLVPRMKTTRVEMEGGRINTEIRYKGEVVTTVMAEQRGNYVVMLYLDGEGNRKGVSFYDPKFVLAN